MTPTELSAVLTAHRQWLHGERGGVRANLTRADLHDANLTRADLHEADLTEANLTRANLARADLTGANLAGAKIKEHQKEELIIALRIEVIE